MNLEKSIPEFDKKVDEVLSGLFSPQVNLSFCCKEESAGTQPAAAAFRVAALNDLVKEAKQTALNVIEKAISAKKSGDETEIVLEREQDEFNFILDQLKRIELDIQNLQERKKKKKNRIDCLNHEIDRMQGGINIMSLEIDTIVKRLREIEDMGGWAVFRPDKTFKSALNGDLSVNSKINTLNDRIKEYNELCHEREECIRKYKDNGNKLGHLEEEKQQLVIVQNTLLDELIVLKEEIVFWSQRYLYCQFAKIKFENETNKLQRQLKLSDLGLGKIEDVQVEAEHLVKLIAKWTAGEDDKEIIKELAESNGVSI